MTLCSNTVAKVNPTTVPGSMIRRATPQARYGRKISSNTTLGIPKITHILSNRWIKLFPDGRIRMRGILFIQQHRPFSTNTRCHPRRAQYAKRAARDQGDPGIENHGVSTRSLRAFISKPNSSPRPGSRSYAAAMSPRATRVARCARWG